MPHTFGAGLIWPRSNEFNLFFLSNMKFLFWLSFFSNNFLRFSLFHSYFSKPLIAFYWVFIELIQLRQITANFPQYYFSMLLPTYLLVFNFLFNLMMSQFGHLFTCNTGFFLWFYIATLILTCFAMFYLFLNLLCCIDCFLQSIFILWVLGLCLIAFRLVLRSLTVFHCSTEFLDEIEFDSILFFSFFWGGGFPEGMLSSRLKGGNRGIVRYSALSVEGKHLVVDEFVAVDRLFQFHRLYDRSLPGFFLAFFLSLFFCLPSFTGRAWHRKGEETPVRFSLHNDTLCFDD